MPPGAVVRRVVMKDSQSVELLRAKLEAMKAGGLFRDQLPGVDPKKPVQVEISFLGSGNYLLVIGSREWVDANIESIRLMAFLYERPRAHVQINMRVVQLTGPANADVIQMSEAVRALVDTQRDEVVRTFADLADYLSARVDARKGPERQVYEAAMTLLPTLADGSRPLTVPEILLLLMVDRASPAPRRAMATEAGEDAQAALLKLPRRLGVALQNPHADEAAVVAGLGGDLESWRKAVADARAWCAHYADSLKKGKDATGLGPFREALQQANGPMPVWLTRRLQRSLELTERLYPNLVRRHMQESLEEMTRRFDAALSRAQELEQALASDAAAPGAVANGARGARPAAQTPDGGAEGEPNGAAPVDEGRLRRNLVALKSLVEELVPAPLALFDSVALAADNGAPSPEQLIGMLRDYARERARMDRALGGDAEAGPGVNYARLQTLEAGLNLWLRRVSEAMARSLEQQFYRRYVNELRLLASKQLGKTSSRSLLEASSIDEVPDVTRDMLLADTGVNIFVSNSISLQFAPDTTNSVSAQVQSPLPSKLGVLERVQQASQAASALDLLTKNYGISGEAIVKALLGGGQAVPVNAGLTLSANPSVGFDAGTVSLSITANQTIQPDSNKIADRVTNHSINNATITALSYEPMVLSTLASNISYYESTGGIPILRKTPILRTLVRDIPFKPFKEGKRQKGVYQSSVLILEPVVIPTIEDLVRFHGGWREERPESAAPQVQAPAPEEPQPAPGAQAPEPAAGPPVPAGPAPSQAPPKS